MGNGSRVRTVVLILGFLAAIASPAFGEVKCQLLGIGGGAVGILDKEKIAFGSLEYRPAMAFYHVKPWVNVYFADDLLYAATGLMMELQITDNLIFSPCMGIGVYPEDDELDLGNKLEFQSAGEFSYRFTNGGRIAASFGHISNGGIGSRNPGTELFKIIYFVPLGKE